MVCRIAAAFLFVLWSVPLHAGQLFDPNKLDGHVYTLEDLEKFDTAAVFMEILALQPELDARGIIQDEVRRDFQARNFIMLESLISGFKGKYPRSKSGLQNRAGFYFSLSNAIRGEAWLDDESRLALVDPSDKWLVLEEIFDKWQALIPDSPTPAFARLIAGYVRATERPMPSVVSERLPAPLQPDPQLALDLIAEIDASREAFAAEPHWYVVRIKAAISADSDPAATLAIIDDGIRTHPDYHEIAFAALRYFLRWTSTDIAALEGWIARTADIAGPDHRDALYARIFWNAFQLTADADLFAQPNIDWKRFKRGTAAVLEEYPDLWNLNNFALFACLAADQSETARIGNRALLSAWGSKELYGQCYEFAALDAGAESDGQSIIHSPDGTVTEQGI